MSEVKTATPSAVSSSAARPPERTAAAAPHSSAHRRVLDLQGGGRRAMMLVGLAEHNQPQPQSEPDLALLVPVLPHSPQTSSCHLQEAQLARLLSVSACNDSFSSPLESHARDNNLRLDSSTRIQLHILARTVYLVKRRHTTCPPHNPTSTPPK